MKRTVRYLVGVALLAGCGGLAGSNASYYKAAAGQTTNPTGTDCPGTPNPIVTLTGIDGDGTIAIYAEPGNQYLLDVGNGLGYTGTLSSGVYTFAGVDQVQTQGNNSITTITKTTITMTLTGPGFTGLETLEKSCTNNAGGANCSSNDGKGFDCTSQASILGTQVTGVVQQSPQAPAL